MTVKDLIKMLEARNKFEKMIGNNEKYIEISSPVMFEVIQAKTYKELKQQANNLFIKNAVDIFLNSELTQQKVKHYFNIQYSDMPLEVGVLNDTQYF